MVDTLKQNNEEDACTVVYCCDENEQIYDFNQFKEIENSL